MEMNRVAAGGRARSGTAILHTVSTEAAWRLQNLRLRYQG
jgi:hypothetical protein